MASHQNRNLNERRREMQIVLDWLNLNGRGIDKLYDHLLAGPGGKRQFRALYRVEPFLDDPDVFAFQIATIRKLRTDADFQRCAEQHFLLQYEQDEAEAAAQAGLDDDCAEAPPTALGRRPDHRRGGTAAAFAPARRGRHPRAVPGRRGPVGNHLEGPHHLPRTPLRRRLIAKRPAGPDEPA